MAEPRRALRRLLPCLLALGTQLGCAILDEDDEAAENGPAPAPTVEIVVEGVDGALAENVRAHLALAAEPCDAPRWRVERLFERVRREAAEALRAFGHYHPRIEAALAEEEGCPVATLDVEPGPRVTVTEVEVELRGEAAGDPAFARLLERLPIAEGEPLNHEHYEDAKQAIASRGAERGYLDGRFVASELKVDVTRNTAEARLVYDSGPRYRFGPLDIEQDVLDPDLVGRLIAYDEDAPYDTQALVALNQRLTDSGYFARIDVLPRLDEAVDRRVPVDIVLNPRGQHAFTLAAGATTDTGPRGRVGYENRRLNRAGHRFATRATASLIEQELSAEYRIPLADPRSEWLGVQAGARLEDTETSESEALKLSVRQTKARAGGWLETRFFDATREDFEVGRQSDTATLFVPGLAWTKTVSDDLLRPRRGYRLNFEIRGTHEGIGSETAFLRATAAAGWVRALPWDGRILARAELGALTVDDFEALPPSQRFFTGGDNSVRGYEFRSLGPRDESGEVVGGRFLATASLEYEHPITGAWTLAGFVDAGNAFDDVNSNDGLNLGIGAGVRWYSPIGPIRLDLAHPLDDEQLVRLHLRLGPDL